MSAMSGVKDINKSRYILYIIISIAKFKYYISIAKY